MRNKWLLGLTLILLIILGLDIKGIYASQYKGELIWSYHRTKNAAGSVNEYYTVKCAISYVAGSYYIVQGRVDYPAMPGEKPLILSGSAIVEGSNIMITMSGAQPWTSGMNATPILYATVDKSTFNGTAWGNTMAFNTANRIMYYDYTAGDLTLTSTPIPLGVSIVPQVQLLLDK